MKQTYGSRISNEKLFDKCDVSHAQGYRILRSEKVKAQDRRSSSGVKRRLQDHGLEATRTAGNARSGEVYNKEGHMLVG